VRWDVLPMGALSWDYDWLSLKWWNRSVWISLFITILLTKLTIMCWCYCTLFVCHEYRYYIWGRASLQPRSKVAPEPQNQKRTLPQPERQVKAKKPEHIRKERRETQENEEKSRLVIYIDPKWSIYCRAGFILTSLL